MVACWVGSFVFVDSGVLVAGKSWFSWSTGPGVSAAMVAVILTATADAFSVGVGSINGLSAKFERAKRPSSAISITTTNSRIRRMVALGDFGVTFSFLGWSGIAGGVDLQFLGKQVLAACKGGITDDKHQESGQEGAQQKCRIHGHGAVAAHGAPKHRPVAIDD